MASVPPLRLVRFRFFARDVKVNAACALLAPISAPSVAGDASALDVLRLSIVLADAYATTDNVEHVSAFRATLAAESVASFCI